MDKGSGSMPLTGPSAKVTTIDDAEEEDDGFETVDDAEGEPSDKVVISYSNKGGGEAGSFWSGWENPNV